MLRVMKILNRKKARHSIVFLSCFLVLFVLFLFLAVCLGTLYTPTTKKGRPLVERNFFQFDRIRGWKLKPNIEVFVADEKQQEIRMFFSTDQAGFRKNSSEEPFPDPPSVILLGDSIVQGYFLFDSETISSNLSRKLKTGVLNAGVGGYSTDQEYLLLQELLKKHRPSWIVLVFYWNDLPHLTKDKAWGKNKPRFQILKGKVDFTRFSLPDKFDPPQTLHYESRFDDLDGRLTYCQYKAPIDKIQSIRGAFFQSLTILFTKPHELRSFLEEQLKGVIKLVKPSKFVLEFPEDIYKNPQSIAGYIDVAFQFLNEMRNVSNKSGAEFLVFLLPHVAQSMHADSNNGMFNISEYFLEKCDEMDIHCLSPHEEFRKKRFQGVYFIDDDHLPPRGTALAAECIADFIQDREEQKTKKVDVNFNF